MQRPKQPNVEPVPGRGVFVVACGLKTPEEVHALITALRRSLEQATR